MTQTTKTTRKKRRRGYATAVIFWICLLLILAPFGVLGWILFSSSMDSNAPVLGNRYKGDLDPAITSSQLEEIRAAISVIPDIDTFDIQMSTATLRVYTDVRDDADEVFCTMRSEELYNTIAPILDPAVYFTQHDGKKMYDLEIHVYNHERDMEVPIEEDTFVYVIRVKNSSMPEARPQVVSSPRNAALAAKLRQDVIDRKAREEAEKAQQEAEQAAQEGTTEVDVTGELPEEGAEGQEGAEGGEQ